jgi:hypothetical protein
MWISKITATTGRAAISMSYFDVRNNLILSLITDIATSVVKSNPCKGEKMTGSEYPFPMVYAWIFNILLDTEDTTTIDTTPRGEAYEEAVGRQFYHLLT